MLSAVRLKVYKAISRNAARSSVDSFISQHVNSKYTLDIGCKDSPYKNLFPNRIGLDVSMGVGVDVVGSIYEIPFPDNTFDVVLCTEVFEHLDNPKQAESELYRVLKKDGKLILTTRFMYPVHGRPEDFFRYTEYGLRNLFKKWNNVLVFAECAGHSILAVFIQEYYLYKYTNKYINNMFKLLAWIFMDKNPRIVNTKEQEVTVASGYYLTATK